MHLPLGDGRVLVHCPLSSTTALLPTGDAELLHSCRAFDTMPNHALHCTRDFNISAQTAADRLHSLVGSGFLLSTDDLKHRLMQSPPGVSGKPINSIGVPTRDRPRQLNTCLTSYARRARELGRDLTFVIADGSDASNSQSNIDCLSEIRKKHGIEIRYIDHEEKARFAKMLSTKSGVPLEAVEFALINSAGFPMDTGCNRNLLLLHSIGEFVLQVDDDTSYRIAEWPEQKPGVCFSSDFNPTEFRFPQEAEIPVADANADFFALHESLLGKSPRDLIERNMNLDQGEIAFGKMSASFFKKLRSNDARVAITSLGILGDSGMGSSNHFLRLEGQSREDLIRSEPVYRDAMLYHRIMRAAPICTISDDAYCMGVNLGLDNTRLLPPFMPVQRNEDGIFSALLRASGQGCYFGFLPWTLAHGGQRKKRNHPGQRSRRLLSGDIIHTMVRSFHPVDGVDANHNLLALSKILIEWGSATQSDFQALIRALMWQQASHQITLLEQLLKKYDAAPKYWADDTRSTITAIQESVALEHYIRPVDMDEAFGKDRAFASLQQLIFSLGKLLAAWPALREAAGQLTAPGAAGRGIR